MLLICWPIFAVPCPQAQPDNPASADQLFLSSPACRLPAKDSSQAGPLLKAIALHPSAGGYEALGNLYVQNQSYACAAAAFRSALSLDGTFWQARYSLGLALAQKGSYQQARAELRKAIAQKPDLAKAHHALGSVLQHLGNTDGAIEN